MYNNHKFVSKVKSEVLNNNINTVRSHSKDHCVHKSKDNVHLDNRLNVLDHHFAIDT